MSNTSQSVSQLLPAYQFAYNAASSAAIIVIAALVFITITTLLLRKI